MAVGLLRRAVGHQRRGGLTAQSDVMAWGTGTTSGGFDG